jgi:hypothetical protein
MNAMYQTKQANQLQLGDTCRVPHNPNVTGTISAVNRFRVREAQRQSETPTFDRKTPLAHLIAKTAEQCYLDGPIDRVAIRIGASVITLAPQEPVQVFVPLRVVKW